MDLSKIKIDMDKANEGVWFDVDTETRLLIARAGNEKFTKALQKAMQPYLIKNRVKGLRDIDPKIAAGIIQDVASRTVLLNWENLLDNGVELPYNAENSLRLMRDPEYVEFQQMVAEYADMSEEFRTEAIQEATKKPESSLDGN